MADSEGSQPFTLTRLNPIGIYAFLETLKVCETIGVSAIQGPESSRAWWRLLGRDDAVLIEYEKTAIQPLLDLHLDSSIAGPFHAGEQLEGLPVVFASCI